MDPDSHTSSSTPLPSSLQPNDHHPFSTSNADHSLIHPTSKTEEVDKPFTESIVEEQSNQIHASIIVAKQEEMLVNTDRLDGDQISPQVGKIDHASPVTSNEHHFLATPYTEQAISKETNALLGMNPVINIPSLVSIEPVDPVENILPLPLPSPLASTPTSTFEIIRNLPAVTSSSTVIEVPLPSSINSSSVLETTTPLETVSPVLEEEVKPMQPSESMSTEISQHSIVETKSTPVIDSRHKLVDTIGIEKSLEQSVPESDHDVKISEVYNGVIVPDVGLEIILAVEPIPIVADDVTNSYSDSYVVAEGIAVENESLDDIIQKVLEPPVAEIDVVEVLQNDDTVVDTGLKDDDELVVLDEGAESEVIQPLILEETVATVELEFDNGDGGLVDDMVEEVHKLSRDGGENLLSGEVVEPTDAGLDISTVEDNAGDLSLGETLPRVELKITEVDGGLVDTMMEEVHRLSKDGLNVDGEVVESSGSENIPRENVAITDVAEPDVARLDITVEDNAGDLDLGTTVAMVELEIKDVDDGLVDTMMEEVHRLRDGGNTSVETIVDSEILENPVSEGQQEELVDVNATVVLGEEMPSSIDTVSVPFVDFTQRAVEDVVTPPATILETPIQEESLVRGKSVEDDVGSNVAVPTLKQAAGVSLSTVEPVIQPSSSTETLVASISEDSEVPSLRQLAGEVVNLSKVEPLIQQSSSTETLIASISEDLKDPSLRELAGEVVNLSTVEPVIPQFSSAETLIGSMKDDVKVPSLRRLAGEVVSLAKVEPVIPQSSSTETLVASMVEDAANVPSLRQLAGKGLSNLAVDVATGDEIVVKEDLSVLETDNVSSLEPLAEVPVAVIQSSTSQKTLNE
ncbi:hypothetical protein HDU76_001307, partial [Blyttiomyces sp. JEL0837]